MSNLDKLKQNLKSSGPTYEFKTLILPYDTATGTPIMDDYLLWCDGTKYSTAGTTNLYLLTFYNYLVINASLATAFTLNTTDQSFIVPNLKDRVLRNTGSLIAPYASQEDAIQNITGNLSSGSGGGYLTSNSVSTGAMSTALEHNGAYVEGGDTGNVSSFSISFDASRVVRTASETRVKAYGVFTCIDISGGAMAQLAKALEDIE